MCSGVIRLDIVDADTLQCTFVVEDLGCNRWYM
jgi:hypothetical protein